MTDPASAESYERALLRGARYVESKTHTHPQSSEYDFRLAICCIIKSVCLLCLVDIWDGAERLPIVWHGHTLTTKVPFTDVIDVINRCAFKASP